MRKMHDSGKTSCSMRFSSAAEAASRPNGFSTTTRALSAHPELPSEPTTAPNRAGGMAR